MGQEGEDNEVDNARKSDGNETGVLIMVMRIRVEVIDSNLAGCDEER